MKYTRELMPRKTRASENQKKKKMTPKGNSKG